MEASPWSPAHPDELELGPEYRVSASHPSCLILECGIVLTNRCRRTFLRRNCVDEGGRSDGLSLLYDDIALRPRGSVFENMSRRRLVQVLSAAWRTA